MSEEISTGHLTGDMITAAINTNPMLRIGLDMIREPGSADGKAYFYAEVPGALPPGDTVVLSIPDSLWAMLGRRGKVIARLSIEDET
jgi:hypothetical protein